MFRKTLLMLTAASAIALSGCDIYFGTDSDNADSPSGDNGDVPSPGEPGWDCNNNWECMSGCFCSAAGICEEAGFCEVNIDCANGFECQEERSSCVPEGTAAPCSTSSDCPTGTYCEAAFGECVQSWYCRSDDECGPGWQCNLENTSCEPMPCATDYDCLEGCTCDISIGQCVETGFCSADGDCLQGWSCDIDRSTCVDVPPQISCEEVSVENECLDRADCSVVYRGINCTDPNGGSCTSGSANCDCTDFVFERCEVKATDPPV